MTKEFTGLIITEGCSAGRWGHLTPSNLSPKQFNFIVDLCPRCPVFKKGRCTGLTIAKPKPYLDAWEPYATGVRVAEYLQTLTAICFKEWPVIVINTDGKEINRYPIMRGD
jgi:hypothetical protein